MKCIPIVNGIICLSRIEFKCPHCKKEHNDAEDKYLNRCNNNKSGYTRIKCSCDKKFGMTYNYMSDAVSFQL